MVSAGRGLQAALQGALAASTYPGSPSVHTGPLTERELPLSEDVFRALLLP